MTDLPTREALGLALLERRIALQLTQHDLAERAQLSQAIVSRIEQARQACTLEQFSVLAKSVRLTRAELFARVEEARVRLRSPKARLLYLSGRTRVARPHQR